MQVSGICRFVSGRGQIRVTRLPAQNPGSRRTGSIYFLAPFPIAVYVGFRMMSPVIHGRALHSQKVPPQQCAHYHQQLNCLLLGLVEGVQPQLKQNPLSGILKPPLRNLWQYRKVAPNLFLQGYGPYLEYFPVAEVYQRGCFVPLL